MTTTTRPSTAVEHAAEARRLLGLIRPDALGATDHAADLLVSPHPVGSPEHTAYWRRHTAALAERLGMQR